MPNKYNNKADIYVCVIEEKKNKRKKNKENEALWFNLYLFWIIILLHFRIETTEIFFAEFQHSR